MLAILFVGTEVTIISNLPALLHTVEFGRILEDAVPPLSRCIGKFDDCRWNGGVNVF
jgi:FHS family L-fucose permease-like MFS transporter